MPTTSSTSSRYSGTAIALHWLIAVLILGGFLVGLYMTGLKLSPDKLKLYAWHKWSGMTVLALALLRIVWRSTHPAPSPLPGQPRWQLLAAQAAHLALYLLILAIPLSGWLYSSASGYPVVYFGIKALQLPDLVDKNKELAKTLKEVHELLNWTMAALVTVHAAAALKHQLIDRDGTLSRMLPWLRRDPAA
ncbi:MAG: cytochrome b [Xanthomonadaceae bacterium]|nr:cytochrome b [Xanthomonadaceae bacterium]